MFSPRHFPEGQPQAVRSRQHIESRSHHCVDRSPQIQRTALSKPSSKVAVPLPSVMRVQKSPTPDHLESVGSCTPYTWQPSTGYQGDYASCSYKCLDLHPHRRRAKSNAFQFLSIYKYFTYRSRPFAPVASSPSSILQVWERLRSCWQETLMDQEMGNFQVHMSFSSLFFALARSFHSFAQQIDFTPRCYLLF
jgi:hypothetical protein